MLYEVITKSARFFQAASGKARPGDCVHSGRQVTKWHGLSAAHGGPLASAGWPALPQTPTRETLMLRKASLALIALALVAGIGGCAGKKKYATVNDVFAVYDANNDGKITKA